MAVSDILVLLGGIALFLFGMSLMGDGLKKAAGNRLEVVLYRLTGTPLKGVLLGTGVTGVIQSSSAASIMVVGFVNSGMMKLRQAIPVIMGTIIGTSITGWVIFLSSLGESGSQWLGLLSTEVIASLFAAVGILLQMISKKKSSAHIAHILLGFAVLMFGMKTMSSSVSGLRESPAFLNLISSLSNPFAGILVGIVATAVLQSSSASVGILQALSSTGIIRLDTALPILMGIAIGAALPVLTSSLSAGTGGKRASLSYLAINVFGVIIIAALYYGIGAIVPLPGSSTVVNVLRIAEINTLLRVIMIVFLFPCVGLIEKAVCALVPGGDEETDSMLDFDRLDERFLTSAPLALEQAQAVLASMAEKSRDSVYTAVGMLTEFSPKKFRHVEKLESLVDRYEDRLGHYLVEITSHTLNSRQSALVGEYLHVVTDLERISDHALNIAQTALEQSDEVLPFSERGIQDLTILTGALTEVVTCAFNALSENIPEPAYRVEPLEAVIDSLCDEMAARHIARVTAGICNYRQGYLFNSLLTDMERISDHCSNIALAVIEHTSIHFDPHAYTGSMQEMRKHGFDRYYDFYQKKYKFDD